MKTVRYLIEEAIWRASESCHDSTLWFEEIDGVGRHVDGLLNRIEEILSDSVAEAIREIDEQVSAAIEQEKHDAMCEAEKEIRAAERRMRFGDYE